jgi:Holliday junction resolvase RusA-like endonuclease
MVMKIIIEKSGKIPSKKNRMKVWRNRMVKEKGVKDFERELRMFGIQQMTFAGLRTLDGPVRLRLDVTFGDKRKRDLQNCFGSVCDALNEVCYHDDSQIVELSGSKQYIYGVWTYRIEVESINDE